MAMKLKSFALLAFVFISSLTKAQSWLDLTNEYIANPNFDGNSSKGWTFTSNASSQALNYDAMEFWYGTFNIHQTINVPNGKYRLSVNAYYRTGTNQNGYPAYQNGTEDLTAFLYANDSKTTVVSIYSEHATYNVNNGCWGTRGNDWNYIYFPNNMHSASQFFAEGKYLNTLEFEVTDNTLTFGLINENYAPDNWCMFDNFRLEYYGEETEMTDIKLSATELNLIEGETAKLTASILPEDATYRTIVWESTDPEVATVDQQGNITAINEGEAVIFVVSERYDIGAECLVTVKANTEGQVSLIINEIQSCNIDMFVDPSFNYGGWIELYNPTDKAVSLYKMHISDDPLNLQKFRLIIGNGIVPAKGFKTIWFDHNNVNPAQVNFKLDYDGGTVYLSDSDGNLITSQMYPVGVPRTSYARTTDGGMSWGTTSTPTPNKSNTGSTFAATRLDAPVVDKDAQLFETPFTACVYIPDGATLCYTTDGSTPTLNNGDTSKTGLFDVSSTTTYRFRLFKDGMLPSQVVTRSYIYKDREYKFPIVSVVTDNVNLYDDSLGVYVKGVNGRPGNGQSSPCNWNMDWDRPVNFELITPEGEMAVNQEVDFAMCGGWSRAWTPHSFKLKASKIYEGKNFYDYPLFADKPHLKHKTLQLRNGGNDTGSRIKDAALQEIVRTSGLYVDGQAYQPIHTFINGEYKSMLNMREPNNKHFAYANYGYDSEELDQFEMSPDSGYCQMEGTKESFLKLHELSANAADPAIYEEICNMVDIDEYLNYMAVEFYLGATDWPQNNVKGFRPRIEGGKFHFVLFDLDGTFGTTNPFNDFAWKQTYTFNELLPSGDRETEEIEFVTIFLNLLQNETFRKQFIDTYCLVAGSVFEPERCNTILDSMAANTYEVLQWEWQNPYNTTNDLKNRLANRQQTMINALKNYGSFQLSSVEEQKIILNADNADARIMVNDMLVPTNKFNGSLFAPITIKTEAPAGYRFVGWRDNYGEPETQEIFSKGKTWKYYDQGSLDGENWTAKGSTTYDENGWSSGKAPLGYAKDGIATTIEYGDNANNKRSAYYFRRNFVLTTQPTADATFTLDYTVDDGFIVYINGTEAGRYLMPNGTVTYGTYATSHATGNPDSGTLTLPASLFVKGLNTIAVEVHNNSASSSDIYFDASLTMTAIPTNGATIVSTDAEFEIPSTGKRSYTACFEPLTDEERKEAGTTPVKVNEISASNSVYINDHYKKNDWIELYNTTDAAIDIAGMYVSDNLNKPQKWQVPASDVSVRTVIDPHGFLIIWADKLAPISQLHSSFKLAAEGGEVLITAADESWCDTLFYTVHNGTQSVGLYPDGSNTVYVMDKPTLAANNVLTSYATIYEEPVIPNSIRDVEISRNGGLSLTYSDAFVTVRSENTGRVRYFVSTIAGQTCMEGTLNINGGTETISLNSLPDGTYIVRVTDSDDNRCTIKVLK